MERVKRLPDEPTWGLWDGRELVGHLHRHTERRWELLDKTVMPLSPPLVIELGQTLEHVGEGWPSSDTLAAQAQQIVQDAGIHKEDFRNYLPWMAEFIRQVYPEEAEHRARLALLLLGVVRRLEDPLLTETRVRLERLAYNSLSEVYEVEAADGNRFQAVERAWREAFHTWYVTLTNPNRAWVFKPQVPQQRERALLDALTLEEDGRRRFRRFFRETQPGRETIRVLIERWFLPRYDLRQAEQLKHAVHTVTQNPEAAGYVGDSRGLWVSIVYWSRRLTWVLLGVYLFISYQLVWGWVEQAGWDYLAPRFMMGLYILCVLPTFLYWLTSGRPDTSTPRLWAGILVAVVGTIMQQSWGAMMTLAHERVIALVALCAFLLATAYRVLLTKVRQATGFEGAKPSISRKDLNEKLRAFRQDPAHRRCMTLVERGLALSFLVSLLLTDLFGDSYLAQMDEKKVNNLRQASSLVWDLPGLVGHTYPALVILFTALTLFAGIFAQLLWEEKPITEGLA